MIVTYMMIGAILPDNGRPVSRRATRIFASLLALAPLGWCFYLTQSRGAIAGFVIGAGGLLFILATRRMRVFLIVAGLIAASAATWFLSTRTQDMTMARGATIRFRIYAWQYAAKLWSVRPISGHGAGAYPMLAGIEGVKDRALDPAAFMGDAVEHAHNELFEILAEIGLIGGLTFVGGFLATLAAASGLLQSNLSGERRWLFYGLVAGVIGLMADAMFGVGLRLPGVAAIFYTLVGVLWAASRSMSRRRATTEEQSGTWLQRLVLRRYGVAAAALFGAFAAAWLATRNWSGALHLHTAEASLAGREFATASEYATRAEHELLDPVRRLVAAEAGVRIRLSDAEHQFAQFVAAARASASQPLTTTSAPAVDLRQRRDEVIRAAEAAFAAAVSLNQRAPTFGRPAGMAARAAEVLAALNRGLDAGRYAHWSSQALVAWAAQQQQRPFDAVALLALARHRVDDPTAIGVTIGLLRDVLRSGAPPVQWMEILQRAAQHPAFERTLADMVSAVGSYGPSSDTDALILSGAAEMHRLNAEWLAARNDFAAAERECGIAAELYRATGYRFPTLESVALTEQSENAYRADPANAARAIELAEKALRTLPVISAQKRAELERPIRERLERYRQGATERTE
jgi:hypothetical protein